MLDVNSQYIIRYDALLKMNEILNKLLLHSKSGLSRPQTGIWTGSFKSKVIKQNPERLSVIEVRHLEMNEDISISTSYKPRAQ